MYHHGWYLVAFEHELTAPLTGTAVGSCQLLLAKTAEGIRAFSAYCPHRGANLAYGGQLDGQSIICPFHQYRVGLCQESPQGFRLQTYQTLTLGGLVFVRLSPAFDNGFTTFMERLVTSHTIIPGYALHIQAPAALIIENGFDNSHFRPVHRLEAEKFVPQVAEEGSLEVHSTFKVRTTVPMGNRIMELVTKLPMRLNAFSPGLSILQIGGNKPYTIITGATATPDNFCVLRISLALSREVYGDSPDPATVEMFLEGSRAGIQDDQLIWEHLSLNVPPKYTALDTAVLAFQQFCEIFKEEKILNQ